MIILIRALAKLKMTIIRRFIVFIKVLFHAKVTPNYIRQIYEAMVCLELEEPLPILGGKLKAYGTTVYFEGDNGMSFAIHEAAEKVKDNYPIYAQELELRNGLNCGKFVYRDFKFVNSYFWIDKLLEIHETFMRTNYYSIRQKELHA